MITPISINIEELNLPTLFPMMVAVIGALVILCIDLALKNLHKSLYVMLTILVLMIDLGTVIGYSGSTRGFFDVMLSRWDCNSDPSDYFNLICFICIVNIV